TYCSLAHGQILVDKFLEPSVVEDLVEDPASAGLDQVETLIVQFGAKVAEDATTITESDIDRLRSAGLSDRDIFDVVLAAAARCFFSKVLDATGTLADAGYNEMEPALREALTVGRPIAREI
ncbi:MAG TPA: peroxidase, partial [Acidimicrobiia bacterium]|nr:peroxidase [Acidimicrobiia bacterium]